MFLANDDYRVEALLAFWLENGVVNLDKLTIQPEGSFRRPYSKDVLEVEQPESPGSGDLTLHISREGLYDMVPEGLFHQAESKSQKSTADAAAESERYRKEEKAARQFFLPLEQEFYRQRIWLEHTELRTWLNSVRPESESFFLNFWGVDRNAFTQTQCSMLLTILPHLHEVVGDMELTAYCLEKMMMEPMSIAYVSRKEEVLSTEEDNLLGSGSLGVDIVLAGSWWADEPAVEVTVGPVSSEKVSRFLPEGEAYKQMEQLYGFLFPAEATVITTLAIEKADKEFKLMVETMHVGRLGYTTEI